MENNIEIQEIEVQKAHAQNDRDLITARYNFLLSEQPYLQAVKPQRFMTSITGGCVTTLMPIYIDSKNTFQDVETLYILTICCFLIGAIITHVLGQFFYEMNHKKALVQNIETLQNWKRPIIILPENRFDTSVDFRANEISNILNDEKCLNQLHIGLENAEMSFEYSIEYGFNTGEKYNTGVGLPIVSLFPELFVLRGAFDDKIWFEFQKEAVRIALEIDNDFAKCWFSLENEKYRAIAGGQLMI